MYTLVWTSAFTRQAKKFLRSHPDLKSRFDETVRDLATDPFVPRLRLYPLGGELDGLHAVRLAYSRRIILTLSVNEHEITLHDISDHDGSYR